MKESELKSLIWDVHDLQTELIDLGNTKIKELGSFKSWIYCHLFRIKLPFPELAGRANQLVSQFNLIKEKINRFRTEGDTTQLTATDKEAFVLFCEFVDALANNAEILNESLAKYLIGSRGMRKISYGEICEDSRRYNESVKKYYAISERLQPHTNRLFDDNESLTAVQDS